MQKILTRRTCNFWIACISQNACTVTLVEARFTLGIYTTLLQPAGIQTGSLVAHLSILAIIVDLTLWLDFN